VVILATQAQNIQFFALVHVMLQHHQQQLSHVPLEPMLEMTYHHLLLHVTLVGKDITVQKHLLLCIHSQHPVLKEHTNRTQEKAQQQTVKLALPVWYVHTMQHAHWQLVLFASQVTLALPKQLVSDKIPVLQENSQIQHLFFKALVVVLPVRMDICVLQRRMFFITP
jgi:hypothetical protein